MTFIEFGCTSFKEDHVVAVTYSESNSGYIFTIFLRGGHTLKEVTCTEEDAKKLFKKFFPSKKIPMQINKDLLKNF